MESVSYRNKIYEIFADSDADSTEQIEQALNIGTEYLDLSIGFLTRITEGQQEILQATGEHPLLQPGESCPLEDVYCRRTIEHESYLAVEDATVSTEISETAIETFDLGAYIGAKIIVDGDVYGTACFADTEPRDEPFDDAERFFVELIARLSGHTIEGQRYERELSARKDRLDEQEEIYRTVIEASFDSVFRFDTVGTFTYASKSVKELLGYSPAELISQPITVTHPDAQTTEWAWEEVSQILNGGTAEARDFPLQTKSGSILYTDIRGVPIYDGSVPAPERSAADITAIQVLVRDASERRQREGLISVINRVLRHNVRNEMSVIRGWAEILSDALDGEQANKATVISAAATRLLDLTDAAQKIEQNRDLSPKLEPTDLMPLLNRTISECETRYPDATIAIDAPREATAATLPRIEVALFELIENAAKHSGEPASVTVNVRVAKRWVICRIQDRGPGLPRAEQDVLETGSETPLVHGQGLGLWLSYWLITTLDGNIAVRDSNIGTTIEIRLPRPADVVNQ